MTADEPIDVRRVRWCVRSMSHSPRLGNVQISDFRNFAHGRHHWLAKRRETTGVLALLTPEDEATAKATVQLIWRPRPRSSSWSQARAGSAASIPAGLDQRNQRIINSSAFADTPKIDR